MVISVPDPPCFVTILFLIQSYKNWALDTNCKMNNHKLCSYWSCTGTRLWVGWSEVWFSSPYYPDWLWGLPSLLFGGYQGSFPGVKQLGCDFNHVPTFSAEVKNEWSYASTPPVCLRGMYVGSFMLTFTLLCSYFKVHIFFRAGMSNLFWKRNTILTVGWFTGHMCKNQKW